MWILVDSGMERGVTWKGDLTGQELLYLGYPSSGADLRSDGDFLDANVCQDVMLVELA